MISIWGSLVLKFCSVYLTLFLILIAAHMTKNGGWAVCQIEEIVSVVEM